MGKLVLLCVVGGAILSVSSGAKAALTTRVSADADALIAELIGTATGLDAGTSTFTGGAHAAGFFARGLASGLGIESGVILTSGSAGEAQGSNSHDVSSYAHGLPGDATLSALAGGEGTYDAAILEFDFTTVGGDLLIRYVFASEEYNEFVYTGHDDIVGIFLDGEDIALVSGTSIPVSVDNVNGGGPGFGVNPSYPEFFHNNDLQNGLRWLHGCFRCRSFGIAPGFAPSQAGGCRRG